jgi:putative hydrolase of the HAD superfamily
MMAGRKMAAMATRLGSIDFWIFDLDNTLYPESSHFFDQISRRMTEFIAAHFGIDPIAARARQRAHYHRYGTTLRGLMIEDGVAPESFLEYVHDIDLNALEPAERLGRVIARLPGTKLVHTNGSRAHAERVLARLGLTALFSGIFDIAAAEWIPKPDPHGYGRLRSFHGVDPTRACMIEDIVANLEPAKAAGMVTVWIDGRGDTSVSYPFVDYRITELASWLEALFE